MYASCTIDTLISTHVSYNLLKHIFARIQLNTNTQVSRGIVYTRVR